MKKRILKKVFSKWPYWVEYTIFNYPHGNSVDFEWEWVLKTPIVERDFQAKVLKRWRISKFFNNEQKLLTTVYVRFATEEDRLLYLMSAIDDREES